MAATKEPPVRDMAPMDQLCADGNPTTRNDRILKRFAKVIETELATLQKTGCIDDAEDTGDVLLAILENRLRCARSALNQVTVKPVRPIH